jgi:hypothetical protein
MWVVIHMCMEAGRGISPYSYLYLNLPNTLCLSYYLLCFLFNKIGEQEGRTGSAAIEEGRGRVERWPKQCIHILINVKKILRYTMLTVLASGMNMTFVGPEGYIILRAIFYTKKSYFCSSFCVAITEYHKLVHLF